MADWIGTSTSATHWSVGLGINTTTPLKPNWSDWDTTELLLLGRIGSSTRAFLSRLSPLAKLDDLQHKNQQGVSSHATMEPLASLLGFCQPSTMASPVFTKANCRWPHHHSTVDAPLQLTGVGRHHDNNCKEINGNRENRS